MSFSEFGFTPEIHRSIRDRGHTQPTPIQQAAIPPALEGKDLVGTAETGSGKTAAYLLPMLDRLIRSAGEPGGRKPIRALVLAPTRELAAQVGREFGLFTRRCEHQRSDRLASAGLARGTDQAVEHRQ